MTYFQQLVENQDAFDDTNFPLQFQNLFTLISNKPQLLIFFTEAYNATIETKSDKIFKSITFVSIAVQLSTEYSLISSDEYQQFTININLLHDIIPFFKQVLEVTNGMDQFANTRNNLKLFLQKNLVSRSIQKVFQKQCPFCSIQCYPKHKCLGLQEKEGRQYFRAKWSTKEDWIEDGNGQRKIEEFQ